ncbi:ATP-binding cassette domain-containing protein [Tessaracoccus massiliensis]|uniref:ATP-binding cassette domain-containing protein n=1 Tax=Tessaracoccus massiliensis TaxID=1522311 RepID=UPI00058C14FD|nr:ATP-binding cassette domain-containing protein [Tessaracoccus massiliensis]
MSEYLLSMEDINKDFSGVKVLKHVNLDVKQGEVHAICGENGAGKSTLMKVLSGVYPHGDYTGRIILDGKEVRFRSIGESEAAGIAIIHQELALIPELSIAENVFLGQPKPSRLGVIDWDKVHQGAEKAIQAVGLHEKVTERVRSLGVGKQQLVEIAKALLKDARLLILDEPTAALNDEESAHLLDLVRGLRDRGVAVVIISHKLGEIQAIADRTTVIRDGETIETLDMHEPESTTDKIISLMVGRSLSNKYPTRESNIGEQALAIQGWTVEHPTQEGRLVLNDVSIDVRHGEVVGIAGLMGAGRTELAMSVFGKAYGRFKSGKMLIDGKEVNLSSPQEAIAAGLAYASEDRKGNGLNLIDSVKHNISLASLGKLTQRGLIHGDREAHVAEQYRQSMRIRTSSIEAPITSLSGGNQQKVVLSKWLYSDPTVLILDEPTRGIDVGAKYEIYTLINDMVAQGKAVIVISSELEEVLGVADRIFVLAYGNMTGQLSRSEANQESLMELMTREPALESSK